MIYLGTDVEKEAAITVAKLMAAAAKTAPKGCGEDNVEVLILDGADKDRLTEAMREIGKEPEQEFFIRDAANIDASYCILLIGAKNSPIGLEGCSYCGFENCAEMVKAGANCAFNITDLGIAVGSAVSVAADNRIDNRVLFSAGKAAVRSGFMSETVRVCYGIPLATASKSVFYDRAEQAEG